jgi:lysophospholipase L1-like esterase
MLNSIADSPVKSRAAVWVACLSIASALVIAFAIRHPTERGAGSMTKPRAPAIHSARQGPIIAVVGDSVAHGAYDTVRGGWVTRLGWQLAADYPHAHLRVLNLSGNGGTSAKLVPTLRRLRRLGRPGVVIIAYGLNDFAQRIPKAVMASHLRAGVRLLRAWPHPPAVVLMGLAPNTALSPARLRLERAYTDVIRRVALAERAGYLDEFDLWLALGSLHLHTLRHDGDHPNRFGYAFTAAGVAAFLEGAYLDRQGNIRPRQVPPTCAAALCGS